MDKADLGRSTLLELLGETGARPVDEVVRALTYREVGVKPTLDLATVIARPDDFKDRLLAELSLTPAEVERREAAAPNNRHTYWLHTLALYLPALWEDPRAFRPIVAYLEADPDVADMQLDDILTEDLPAILARTYDGSDLRPLKALIENPNVPAFVRSACLRGLHAMARLNKLKRAEVVAYFEELTKSIDGSANEDFVDVFAMDLSHLQEPHLRPVIDRWFSEGLIDEMLLSRADVDETYRAPHDELNEELTRRERFDGLIDYLSEWPWFLVSDPSELEPIDSGAFDDGGRDVPAGDLPDNWPIDPYVRQGRKVGRNEPCPCGSGKKYKKCCLDADSG